MCKDISVDNKSTNLDNMNNITVEPQTQQMDLSVRHKMTKKVYYLIAFYTINTIICSPHSIQLGKSGRDVQHAPWNIQWNWKNKIRTDTEYVYILIYFNKQMKYYFRKWKLPFKSSLGRDNWVHLQQSYTTCKKFL